MVGSLEASSAEKKAARWAGWKAGYWERTMADHSGWKRVASMDVMTEMCLVASTDISKDAYSDEKLVEWMERTTAG